MSPAASGVLFQGRVAPGQEMQSAQIDKEPGNMHPWLLLSRLLDSRTRVGDDVSAVVDEGLIDAFICCEIGRVLEERNRAMRISEQELTYEVVQAALFKAEANGLLSSAIQEALGPFSLLSAVDARAIGDGVFAAFLSETLNSDILDKSEFSTEMARTLGL
jgi:hypothetical protein